MPPPLTNSSEVSSPIRRMVSARRPAELGHGPALDQPDHPGPDRVAGRRVAQARDLALVAHDTHQGEAGPGHDRGGELRGLLRGEQRRAPGTDVHGGPAGGPVGHVKLQADPDPRVAVAQRAVHHVKLGRGVGHDGDLLPRRLVRGQRPQRRPVHGGVGHQQVVAGARGLQPQGLGQRIAHDPLVARGGQRPLDQEPAAQRLGRDPDRQPGRAPGQVRRVRVEGGQVDQGQRRVLLGGGAVVAGAEVVAAGAGVAAGPAALVNGHGCTVDRRPGNMNTVR